MRKSRHPLPFTDEQALEALRLRDKGAEIAFVANKMGLRHSLVQQIYREVDVEFSNIKDECTKPENKDLAQSLLSTPNNLICDDSTLKMGVQIG